MHFLNSSIYFQGGAWWETNASARMWIVLGWHLLPSHAGWWRSNISMQRSGEGRQVYQHSLSHKRLPCGQGCGHLGRVAPSEALGVNSQPVSQNFLKQTKKKSTARWHLELTAEDTHLTLHWNSPLRLGSVAHFYDELSANVRHGDLQTMPNMVVWSCIRAVSASAFAC